MDNLWYILNRQVKGFYLSHRTESIIQIICIRGSWRWSLFTVQELDVPSDGNSRIVMGISMGRNLTESCHQTSLPAFAYIFSQPHPMSQIPFYMTQSWSPKRSAQRSLVFREVSLSLSQRPVWFYLHEEASFISSLAFPLVKS